MNKKLVVVVTGLGLVLVLALFSNLNKTSQDLVMDKQQSEVLGEFKASSQDTESSIALESGPFFFNPNVITAQAGEVTIDVTKNQGFHTFVIDELGVKETIVEGQTIKFKAEPGTYTYYCDVPGHREQGQEGTLIVK